jgi:glycerate-2-kinase
VLGARIVEAVMTANASVEELNRWKVFPASHPKPTAASEDTGRAALALADRTRKERGVLIVCLSGGASAMMAVPAPGLTIADKAATTAALLAAGLDIGSLNVVRRHLSAVKGGQLAARAGRSITLAISDVCTPVEDDPMVIGSGPTAGDASTFADAYAVVRDAGLLDRIPASVRAHLEAGMAGTVGGPVPSDDERLREAAYWLIASRRDAMQGAADVARRLGYSVTIEGPPVIGEARDAAAAILRRAQPQGHERPACLISSGETTVHVRGTGTGGRNQELALAAMTPLAELAPAALASIGTDGADGPTDAAGAMIDSSTLASLGEDAAAEIQRALSNNDAYPLLDRLGAIVRTGPTGTNVGDLQVVLLR